MGNILYKMTPIAEHKDMLRVGKAGEHLVCCDLLLKGYNAFLADQGLSYDVVVETKNGLKRIQVKTSLKKVNYERTKDAYRYKLGDSLNSSKYRFNVRQGNLNNHRRLDSTLIDYIALVAMDKLKVCYIPIEKLLNKDNNVIRAIDIRFKDEYLKQIDSNLQHETNPKARWRVRVNTKFFEDFEYL